MNTAAAAKHILIVDDDASARDGLACLMRAAGHDVRQAANGAEVLCSAAPTGPT